MTTAANRRWVLHVDLDAFFASAEQLTSFTTSPEPYPPERPSISSSR